MEKPLAVYVRVSRVNEREEDKFHSPREQEARARSFAANKGYAVSEVIQDLDVSGATHPDERPGMHRALELVRAGEIGGIAAYSLDRLSRDPGHGDWLIREVTSHGAVLLAPDIPSDITSPTGEFTYGMLLQVAKLYRSMAAARFEGAKERSIKAGIPIAPVPFGYRQLPNRTIEPDPEHAPLVVELFLSVWRARGMEHWPNGSLRRPGGSGLAKE